MTTTDINHTIPLPPKFTRRRRSAETIRRHRLPTCPTTGKLRYRDHDQARDGLGSTTERRLRVEAEGYTSRRREIRTYKCSFCAGWHSTSQPDLRLVREQAHREDEERMQQRRETSAAIAARIFAAAARA